MNETVRKMILTGYLKEKEKLEKEIERVKELEETETVKEYLNIQKSLTSKIWPFDVIYYDEIYGFTLNDSSIIIQEHDNHLINCEHDTLLYLGNYTAKKRHKKENNTYIKSKRNTSYQARKYYCLDCGLTKLVFLNEVEEFEKCKTIITDFNEHNCDLNELRNEYFNLLIENSSDIAIKKLKK